MDCNVLSKIHAKVCERHLLIEIHGDKYSHSLVLVVAFNITETC